MKPAFLMGMIGLVLIGVFGYHRANGRQQERVRLIQTQIAKERANQKELADVAERLQQIEQYRKRLPPDPDSSWLVREVVKVAEQTGIQFTTISPEVPQDSQQYTRLVAHFQFSGSYHKLGMFLDHIEHAEPFLRVNRVEISEPPASGGDSSVRVTLSTVSLLRLREREP